MPKIDPFALQPEEVISYFRAKGYRKSWNWQDTLKEEHAKAFTVAHCMKMDILQDIRQAYDKALAEGKSLSQFKLELMPVLQAKGWWGKKVEPSPKTGLPEVYTAGTPWRLNTIYRTNMATSYAAGRYQAMMANVEDQPLWMYDAVNDSRTRPSHAALDGQVFPADDPFWGTHYPPNGFNCRCGVTAMSESQARRYASRDPRMVIHESSAGFNAAPPDEGWDYNPGKAAWRPALGNYDERLAVQYQQAVREMGIAESEVYLAKLEKEAVKTGDPDVDVVLKHALANVKPNVKAAIQEVFSVGGVKIVEHPSAIGGSYYDFRNLVLSGKDKLAGEHRLVMHELGHALDNKSGIKAAGLHPSRVDFGRNRSNLQDSRDAMDAERTRLDKSTRLRAAIKKELRMNFAYDWQVKDLFESVTIYDRHMVLRQDLDPNVVGQGHGNAYYAARSEAISRMEATANMVEIYTRNDKYGWKYVKKRLPKLAKLFESWMKSL